MKPMRLFALPAMLLLAAGTTGAKAADQMSSVTLVLANFADTSILAGMKTSDVGAAFEVCNVGSIASCIVTEQQTHYPKNIGNALCVESGTKVVIDAACNTLLTQSSGNCQPNSAIGSCSPRTAYGPACNYRTQNNYTASANWQWFVTRNSDGSLTVGCNKNGYDTTSPN